jgi:hypothetical protein
MVKFYLLLYALFTFSLSNAQVQDTLNCEKIFRYYENLLSDKVIFIWDTAPSLKKCSYEQLELLKKEAKNLKLEPVFIAVIIDSDGIPVCFKFYQRIASDKKQFLIDRLEKFRFNPAFQEGKAVESFYTFKI